ncbi:ABC transporter ATP-binding protein [Tengunoibacter tsumagoiensis]|uniref:Dipeptide/oligopeptide/nickel ABC transporter ATP-binding protein n=1 Tax=Tengunoibacter tsumagoiensis TaxID=2014871 RepID=A0A402A6G5_9CHLR|nr:ABC transporter ATP-binding protein [Tengunoibacter tsumagoiensis]GCE14722.1 dipeptide/oligopeptide/nickel ABC transporter ATP-binding protein [Tengunoibacter tsumagoiensis]
MATGVPAPTLLEVNNLNIDYYAANGAVHAVRDVSFSLKRGEILGLAGESGCGKSTLAFGIARLLRPPAVIAGGEVLYYPRKQPEDELRAARRNRKQRQFAEGSSFDILQLTPKQLQAFRWNELAIVFQSAMNALNPVMTVGRQITDVLETHRPDMTAQQRQERAAELFKMVGIAPDRLKSYPHELSGGMRQRAVIAIALALNPELIIMDEPTTALDVVVQREILELISKICKETSTALIFITHDLSLLIELADRIAIMYAGKMIERSTSQAIYQQSRHPYSYGLLNSFPTLHGPRRKMVGIPGSPPDLRALPAGCPFHARCPFAFEACTTVQPQLSVVDASQPDQQVACHLYDQTYTQQLPTVATLAAGYEALAEGREVR